MIKINPNKCANRQCILEVSVDGKWVSAAYSDPACSIPVIFACEHEAFDMQVDIMVKGATLVAIGDLRPQDFPGPQQFRLKHVDKVPKSYDAEVKDLSHAEAIIRRLQGSIKG
jgi:hypothetical protein